jgi:hypothetical protein
MFVLCLFTSVLALSCKNYSICPDDNKFNFFSDEELIVLWEDINFAKRFQSKVSDTNSISVAEVITDTVRFLNKSDTLDFICSSVIQSGHNSVCVHDIPMIAYSYIQPIDDYLFHSIQFQIEKTIVENKPVHTTLDLSLENEGKGYFTTISYNDTITFSYNSFNNSIEKSNIVYLSTQNINFSLGETIINGCLAFKFFNEDLSLIFQIIYSNKYGFIQIFKNEQYEINRII